ALDRGRVDVGVVYKNHTYPVELKLAGPKARKEGLEQLQRYMDTCGATEGWLVIFDRNAKKPWSKRIYWTTETLPDGGTAHIVGC
ncbi:MAG: type I restriction enzyme HsdR N-terminal domain-containing protein, partial [Methylobacteriaceae bacterium]|nr:type I restriction enzyme HsdR N-terminal domain-containing protein [Methylobacteriaceae bacterium]